MTSPRSAPPRRRGFTFVELLIVVAVVVVLLMVAAPSMRDFIELQRLRSVNADLVTDVQYARSEAVSRAVKTVVKLSQDANVSCYTILTGSPGNCDCLRGAGAACTAGTDARELRTTTVARSTGIRLNKVAVGQPSDFTYDPRTGGLESFVNDLGVSNESNYAIEVRGSRRGWLVTTINPAGRATVCSRDAAVTGVAPC